MHKTPFIFLDENIKIRNAKKRIHPALGISAGVFLCISPIIVWGFFLGSAFMNIERNVRNIQADISQRDLPRTQKDVERARESLARAQQFLILGHGITRVPWIGEWYSNIEVIAKASDESLRGAEYLVRVGISLASALGTNSNQASGLSSLSPNVKAALLQSLVRSEPDLIAAHTALGLALRDFDALDDTRTSALKPIVKKIREQDENIYSTLDYLLPYVSFLPAFAGFPTEKTYLFLLQNNTEVRGTGGFIGNYGILKIHNGAVVSFKTDNIYNIDDAAARYLAVKPPMPFIKYFPHPMTKWFLRDSNWSPDFRDAARQAEWFYEAEGGRERLDGVIAMTPDVMESFLRVIGSVQIDGLTFTADNFVDQLQYHVEKGYVQQGIPERQRKEIVGRIGAELLARINTMSMADISQLARVVETKFNEKNFLIYANDPSLEAMILDRHWGGAIGRGDGDFLMVVDSNLASLKTDMVMQKTINYTVEEQPDGSFVSRVELIYRNNGMFSWNTTRYRDWVRILVPEGSQIIRSQGAMVRELSEEPGTLEISHIHDKMEIGAYIVVEPRTTKRFIVEYRLPQWIVDREKSGLYTLFVQKQSGVSQQQFVGNFSFQRTISAVEPRGFFNGKTGLSSAQVVTDLRLDRVFNISF